MWCECVFCWFVLCRSWPSLRLNWNPWSYRSDAFSQDCLNTASLSATHTHTHTHTHTLAPHASFACYLNFVFSSVKLVMLLCAEWVCICVCVCVYVFICLPVCVCVCVFACRHVRVCELQSRAIVADSFRSRCHCESLQPRCLEEERCCDDWTDRETLSHFSNSLAQFEPCVRLYEVSMCPGL